MRDVEKVQQALVIGPDGAGRVAGERARGCDPFYRAWLRGLRRALVEGTLLQVPVRDVRDALLDGRPFTDTAAVVRLLADCARVHEAFEEVLMEIHRVPGREVHLEAHRSLGTQREDLCAAHAAGHDRAQERWLRASRNGR